MKIRTLTYSLLFASTALTAQAALADPPAFVGRVSYVSGIVSTHGPDAENWDYVSLNSPVTSGYSFWTEPKAHSEIQAGPAEVRLDEGTELDITRLDDSGTELNVPQGIVNIHLHSLPPGGMTVDTPQGQVRLDQPGSYDIDAGDPGNDTTPPRPQVQVSVLEGQAKVTAQNGSFVVSGGEAALIDGAGPVHLVDAQPTPFDDWALAREHREHPPQALQYVSPEETGYQDLDTYGQWQQAPQYGTVWYPNDVSSDWTPYSDGRWDYVQPWGWTWVDNAPWGFTPFHYGRWVQTGGRWGWWPGEGGPPARPVYAPALVAFLGDGVSVGIGAQPVGWVPLAPYEVYRPWYARDPGYWRDVNRPFVRENEINNITINNYGSGPHYHADHYANATRGATFVSGDDFRRGAHVHGSQMHVPPETLAQAPVNNRAIHDMRPDAAASGGRGDADGGYFHRPAPTPPHEAQAARPVTQGGSSRQPDPQAARNTVFAPGPTRSLTPAANRQTGEAEPRRLGNVRMPSIEQPAAADAGTPMHAPGPAIHRNEAGGANREVFAPNQEAPHDRHADLRPPEAAAPHPDAVTTPREREDYPAATPHTAPVEHEATPATAPHIEQHAPLTATPHGWQRGDGGGHVQPHAQHVETHASHAAPVAHSDGSEHQPH